MEGKKHYANQEVEWASTQRMHTMRRSSRLKRWTPAWAMSNEKTRLVVYTYTWRYVKHILGGTPEPGIPLAKLEVIARTACREKIAKRLNHIDPYERSIVEQHLNSSEKGIAARVARLIYLCYRQGFKAPDAAQELGMTWCSVRQLLHRLNVIARGLFPDDCSVPHPSTNTRPGRKQGKSRRVSDISEMRECVYWRQHGATIKEVAVLAGVSVKTMHGRLKTMRREAANA
jgi:hypothetical protein